MLIGYPDYRPLVRKDLTVLPAGIHFSVGAHCIGTAEFAGLSDRVPGWETRFFRRGDELIGTFERMAVAAFTADIPTVTLAVVPQDGYKPALTDAWGRSHELEIPATGVAKSTLTSTPLFLNGCREFEALDVASRQDEAMVVAEAEKGALEPWLGRFAEGELLWWLDSRDLERRGAGGGRLLGGDVPGCARGRAL